MNPKTGEVAPIEKTAAAEPIVEDKTPLSVRSRAIEEIARRRETERRSEIDGQNFDVMDEDGNIMPAAPREAVEVEPTEELEKIADGEVEPPPKVEPEVEEETRELLVDGQKVQVPLSKILDAGIRTFQKESTADMRLAAASEMERQARARLENFVQPPKDVQPEPPSDDDRSLSRAIQYGTEDESVAAIAKLRQLGKASNPQEMQQFVQKNLSDALPMYLAFHDAGRWVRSEYKEIFDTPELEQDFKTREEFYRFKGDKRPFMEVYKDIAEKMSKELNLKPVAKAAPISADRVVRKSAAPKVADTAAGRTPAPQPQKQQTVSDYVERQRQLRGLASMPHNQQGI